LKALEVLIGSKGKDLLNLIEQNNNDDKQE
jgi:hypothetical protein